MRSAAGIINTTAVVPHQVNGQMMPRVDTALELAVAELEKNSKFRLGGVLSEPTAVSAWNGILNHPMALCRTNRLDVGSPVSGTLVWVVSVGDEDG